MQTAPQDRDAPLTLGVDLGGTGLRLAAVDSKGAIRARAAAATPLGGEPGALTVVLREALAALRPPGPLRGRAGVCLPGIRDAQGVLRRAVNLPRLEGVQVEQFFADALAMTVTIESDANAAAWAQWRASAPPAARFAYLTLGTGVGGGVVLDGRLVRHTGGGAGHFGFLIVDTTPAAPSRLTGLPGCLSEFASGAALERADAQGLDRAADALAVAIQQLASVYAPEIMAIGGGVTERRPELVALAAAALERKPWPIMAPPHVIPAYLPGDDAGVIGAALLAD